MGSVGAISAGRAINPENDENVSSPLDLNNLSSSEALSKIVELQQEMGQTGDEAGKPDVNSNSKLYVNTGKSFNINAYLLSDGKTYESEHTDWGNYINKTWIKNAINKIDGGMKPLTQDMKVYRYIDSTAFSKMLGLNLSKDGMSNLINSISNGDKDAISSFGKVLNQEYIHKAYSSTTYDIKHGSYDSKDVRLNITFKKGTPVIVTNNHAEHEILGGHGLKYNFTKKFHVETTKTGKKQLVVDVVI